MTTYLIVGNGVAGNAAAENIRKHDPEGKIVVFSQESRPFYYVPALPEYLAGEKAADQIILHQQSWYWCSRITSWWALFSWAISGAALKSRPPSARKPTSAVSEVNWLRRILTLNV